MKKQIVLVISLLIISLTVSGKEVRGKVIDKKSRKGIELVTVVLKNSKGIPLSYVTTDEMGFFSVTVPESEEKGVVLEASFIGYSSFKKSYPFPDFLEVVMEEMLYQIDEAVVKAENVKITGDTTSYYLPTLIRDGDRNLGDVLKRLPGVSVGKDGKIAVYGKELSMMMIEGTDLLGGRYNIATKNIDPEDIAKVEVIEGHQPIKHLHGKVGTEDISINVIMKENAKEKWLATLEAKAGYSTGKPHVPYSGSLMVMNISKVFQTINLLKGDATGDDITIALESNIISMDRENPDFYNRYLPARYIGITHSNAPLQEFRTKFNNTWAVSTNNKFMLGKDTKVGINALYEYEKLTSNSLISHSYTLEEGEKVSFIEDNDVFSKAWFGSGGVDLSINSEKFYLEENFQFEASGSGTINNLDGTEKRDQNADLKSISFLNNLDFRKGSIGFNMFTQYTEQNETLSITSPEEEDENRQRVNGKYFYNDLTFEKRFRLNNNLSLNMTTKIGYLHRSFNSALRGVQIDNEALLDNDVTLQYLKPTENIRLKYESTRWKIDTWVNLYYQYLFYRINKNEDAHKFGVNPGISAKFKVSPRYAVYAGGAFSISPVMEDQIFDALIMHNYKYFTQGRRELLQTPSYNLYLGMEFSEPLSGWFLDGNVKWRAGDAFRTTRYFLNDYIINKLSTDISGYSSLSVNAEISKSIYEINGKIKIYGTFLNSAAMISQNDIIHNNSSYTYTAGININSGVTSWLGMIYEGGYNYSRSRTDGEWEEGDSHDMYHNLTLSLSPIEKIQIEATAEYYFNKYASDKPSHTIFVNCVGRYLINDRLEVYIDARNLLDKQVFSYSFIGPLETIRYDYRIRPLNILAGVKIRF